MSADEAAVVNLVEHSISQGEAKDCRVYIDPKIKETGELVRIGLREVPMPFRGTRIFIDLLPHANWGHRAVYLLASLDFAQHQRFEEQFPPCSCGELEAWRSVTLP